MRWLVLVGAWLVSAASGAAQTIALEPAQAAAKVEALGGKTYSDAQGTVRIVDLARPSVGDSDLDLLSAFPGLRSLDLDGSAVTDAGLLRLSSLPMLEELSLRRTAVTPAAVAEFRRQFPHVGRVVLSLGAQPRKWALAAAMILPLGLGLALVRLSWRRREQLSGFLFARGVALGAVIALASLAMVLVAGAQALGYEVTIAKLFD
ncbi:MAG: hypothetical protein AB7I19_14360 [Planctomycetota bacterium]